MYIHLCCMATKCITITVEAYERLASQKKEKESFTDVINRITPPRRSLLELAGILTHKEAEEMKKYIAERRKHTRVAMEKRLVGF